MSQWSRRDKAAEDADHHPSKDIRRKVRSSEDTTEGDEQCDHDTERSDEGKPSSQHRRDGKTRRAMSRGKGVQSRCPGKGHLPVSRMDELRSRPADEVFQPIGEQRGDAVSDQRLDGHDLDCRLFKGPRAEEEKDAHGGQAPALPDPVSRIAGERHPWNSELIPGEMNRHRSHILGNRQVKLGHAEKADDQRGAGRTDYGERYGRILG